MIDEFIQDYCKNYKGKYRISYFLDDQDLAIKLDSKDKSFKFECSKAAFYTIPESEKKKVLDLKIEELELLLSGKLLLEDISAWGRFWNA
jgi:hypothetical protein